MTFVQKFRCTNRSTGARADEMRKKGELWIDQSFAETIWTFQFFFKTVERHILFKMQSDSVYFKFYYRCPSVHFPFHTLLRFVWYSFSLFKF